MDKKDVTAEMKLVEAIHSACSHVDICLANLINDQAELERATEMIERTTQRMASRKEVIERGKQEIIEARIAYADFLGKLMMEQTDKLPPVTMGINVHDLDSLESRGEKWESIPITRIDGDEYPF